MSVIEPASQQTLTPEQLQETAKLRVELSMLRTQQQSTQKELQVAQTELAAVQNLFNSEASQNLALQSKITELTDQNKLLQ
jgi:hypothetical protein